MRSSTNMRAEILYQTFLVIAGVIVTALLAIFLYREIFPEYKTYQKNYAALEEFRSTYTHESPPPFQFGIQQIVLEREDRGPPVIDRCLSCHVALQVPYFSPTKIAHDLNGNIVRDHKGHPVLIPNEEYIWQKLDEKIAELRDEKIIEQLRSQGKTNEIHQRLNQAVNYEALKTAYVGDYVYDITKVLVMHPLMGGETRPFEYHPIEEYGCTSCHNGNGRGLTTDKAHGPVFDGQYEIEFHPTRQFTESDPRNDPEFAYMFNHKPGAQLLFQTEPIFVGALIQAKCMQCHQTSNMRLAHAAASTTGLSQRRQKQLSLLLKAYQSEKQNTLDLLKLRQLVERQGYVNTLKELKDAQTDYSLPTLELEHVASQIHYLEKAAKGQSEEERAKIYLLAKLNQDLVHLLGSDVLVEELEEIYRKEEAKVLDPFIQKHQQDPEATGTLFAKGEAVNLNQDLMQHAQGAEYSFTEATKDQKIISALSFAVDGLTRNYQRGKELYLSQACYACHRIAGLARGGVGPDLTLIGNSYPWYVKESIVWPQADLPTSTMPNMRMDHQELEDLMAFLLAQKGGNRAIAKTTYQEELKSWEAGRKMPWEKPISPAQIYDLRYSMTLFATQGCSACHRLQGFESDVGFKIEKDSPSFDQLYEQQSWFRKLFPEVVHLTRYDEELPGSEIVERLDKYAQEIDERIVSDVRQNSILEEINRNHPEMIESLYSPFRYAARSKNDHYETLIAQEKDPKKMIKLKEDWQAWKDRVHRVLMMYVQIYGLGRLIGPHLNWSGIYRTDEWLMEHFRKPSGHVPRSIMPVFPFDDTKFYALIHMLDLLAVRNRQALRDIWSHRDFDAKEAYDMLCAQCHGIDMYGNGAIAEWIYPIPKNLRNPEFLRHLTKEKAVYSMTHGVKGTPMLPWGECAPHKSIDIQTLSHGVAVLNATEIGYLVDWLFSSLPGREVIRQTSDVLKWRYTPEDVLEELREEGGGLILGRESSVSFLDVFDKVPHPTDTGPSSYYIKKELYMPDNIEQGQKFFLLNCAVCHGNEGEGGGVRSAVLQSAKPRMFTNLDWIRSRDDLRLLRSIKYGVPGTAMTPWGDLTSSSQRLQLVMFIRSLTEEMGYQDQLEGALYQTFESAKINLENARVEGSQQIERLQEEQKKLQGEQEALQHRVAEGQILTEGALQIYQRSLELGGEIGRLRRQDHQLIDLKNILKQERELYFNLGMRLIRKGVSEATLLDYLDLIRLNAHRYTIENHWLNIHFGTSVEESIRMARRKVVRMLDQKMVELEKERRVLEGKMASAQRKEELNVKQAEIEGFKKLNAKLVTDTEEALRLANQQVEIVQALGMP